MFTENLHKETVFFIGLILNIITSVFSVVLIILSGVQYKYININWTKINFFRDLNDLELSSCIINVICCILGFFIFIKKFECKTLQKIYIVVGSLIAIYSIIVCILSFFSIPKVFKENSANICQASNFKGILKNMNKIENVFYSLDEYICSNECPCNNNENMNYEKCKNPDILLESLSLISDKKIVSNFNTEKFVSYWSFIEEKFDCVGLCNTSYISTENNNFNNINKYLFSDNTNSIKNFGCVYPLSDYLNKIIITFSILLLINILFLVMALYIGIAIYLDKVFEGSNLPQKPKLFYEKGVIGKNILRQVNIIQGSNNFGSVNVKINNNETN